MRIMGTGINYTTGAPLIPPMNEEAFARGIQASLGRNAEEMRTLTRASTPATTFRGAIERAMIDPSDPRAAGWTYLLNEDDPRRRELIETLRPLAEHRGMEDLESPLLFRNEGSDQWYDWLLENYYSLEIGEKSPHYVLIVGGPDKIPFHFQSFLDSAAAVGRVDFESLDDLRAYIHKLIELERAPTPVVSREAIFFATDEGIQDPTYFSRRYMAEPLAQRVNELGFNTVEIMGQDATKQRLIETLSVRRPALVYTASHGLGAPDEDLEIQKRYNGAICCRKIGHQPVQQWLFSADDVPADGSFLEGAIFFQFACFGYGTPSESDFMHWFGNPEINAEEDFVSALPKKILAQPRGPVAFIGHVDTAWLHGFDDPESPFPLQQWHPRISPFVSAVENLLEVLPTGLAMADMNKRYDLGNALITAIYDRIERGRVNINPEILTRLANAFILRSDAQNYMIFGDPAARVRIPQESE